MASRKTSLTTKDLSCLNCERPLTGEEKFCPECGQKNRGKNLKLKDFMREVFAGFFSWDAKFWRTLVPLLTKPGKISKDYIEGKRIRFTNPFRFFFIISIIFFFLVKLNTKYEDFPETNYNNNTQEDSISKATIFKTDIGKYISFQKKYPKLKVESALDSLNEKKTFFNKLYYKKAKTINGFSSNTNESTNKLIKLGLSYLSSAFLFLLPVFALFLKLFYVRRKLNYMNHLIFMFHIATFFFLYLSLFQLIRLFPFTEDFLKNTPLGTIGTVLIFIVYPFVAMKTFYQQSYFKTFLKLLLISIVFSLLIMIAIALIFILAFFMM